MSDQFWAEIEIGGPIHSKDLPKLKELLEYECMEIEELDTAIETNDTFEYSTCDASNGEFRDLEDFLKEKNIAYMRQSQGEGEIEPELIWKTPDNEGYVIVNNNGQTVITKNLLVNTMEFLNKYTAEPEQIPLNINTENNQEKKIISLLLEQPELKYHQVLTKILEDTYPEPPVLEPITIVED